MYKGRELASSTSRSRRQSVRMLVVRLGAAAVTCSYVIDCWKLSLLDGGLLLADRMLPTTDYFAPLISC